MFQQAGAWMRANFAAKIGGLLHEFLTDEAKITTSFNRPPADRGADFRQGESLGDRAIGSGDVMMARMRIYRIAGNRRTRVADKVLRLSLVEKAPPPEPEEITESAGSFPAFSVGCQMESYSIPSLKRNQKRYIQWLEGGSIHQYEIRRSEKDPLQYYIANGTIAISQLRTADEAELFRAAESSLGELFGKQFGMMVKGILADEAQCAAFLRSVHYPDESQETKTHADNAKK